MSKHLFIIEANGKKQRLKKILDELGLDDFQVFATFGRLLDLPKESFGIDKDTMKALSWDPVNDFVFDALSKSISGSVKIYILTDNDQEGEHIASQIADSFSDRKEDMCRLRVSEITKKNVEKALQEPQFPIILNPSDITSVKARRVFDRAIGYVSMENDKRSRGTVSRVKSPILKIFDDGAVTVAKIIKKISSVDGPDWTLSLSFNKGNKDKLSQANVLLETSSISATSAGDYSVKNLKPYRLSDILIEVSEEMGIEPSTISDIVQDFYEDGKLNYPRTSSEELSEESFEVITDYMYDQGYRADQNGLRPGNSKSHSAIFPTGECNLREFANEPESSNGFVIKKILLRAVEKAHEHQLITELGRLGEGSLNIEKELERMGVNFDVSRNWGGRDNCPEWPAPDYRREGIQDISIERQIIKEMVRNNIAKPSTYSMLAKSMTPSLIDSSGDLTSLGLTSLKRSKEVAPEILDLEQLLKINEAFENVGSDEGVAAQKAMEHVGEIKGHKNVMQIS